MSGEFLSELSVKSNIPKEKIRCEGCSALTPDCWGEQFKEKSCDKYENLASRYLKRGEDIRKELGRIREMGFERWLYEQDLRWRCDECLAPISVHASKCYSCGHPLSVNCRR